MKTVFKNRFLPFLMIGALAFSFAVVALAQEVESSADGLLSEEAMMKLFKEQSAKFKENGGVVAPTVSGDKVDTSLEGNRADADEFAQPNMVSDAVEPKNTVDTMSYDVSGSKVDVSIVPHGVTLDYTRPIGGYVPLGDIRLAVDMSNQTLLQIIDEIVAQASVHTGAWHVKWRLRKEHEFLLNEKVNLTAESSFREFIDHLVDRVNNMTGIHLFVTIFETSRVIVISDTYY